MESKKSKYWELSRDVSPPLAITSERGIIAQTAIWNEKLSLEEIVLNAQLIAAAPAMLDVCKEVLKTLKQGKLNKGDQKLAIEALEHVIDLANGKIHL